MGAGGAPDGAKQPGDGGDPDGVAGPIVGGLVAGPFGVAAALHALPLAVYAVYVLVLGGLYLRPLLAARR